MALLDIVRSKKHDVVRDVPVCDASCRLDQRPTVARTEAAILTTRVR